MDKNKLFQWKQTIGFFIEVSLFVASGYLFALRDMRGLLAFLLGLGTALRVADWIKEYTIMSYKEERTNGK